jgi:endonuclease-3
MPPRTRLRTAAGHATNSVSTPAIKQSPSEVVSPVKRSQSSQALSPEKSPSKKKSKTIVKQALVEPVPPPPRWREAYALITEQRKTFIAPVDTMGCDKAGDMILEKIASGESINQESVEKMKERFERDRRLACLVSLMLSSQTKDEVTAQATLNLRLKLKNSLTVDSLRGASLEEIESCINKVGFWKKKAQYIKLMADDLFIKHQSDVPKTLGKHPSHVFFNLFPSDCS